MKIALLSNVNLNPVIRLLSRNVEVYQPEGYGNELGTLINPDSSLFTYEPEIVFLIPDLMELIQHELRISVAKSIIEKWFSTFEASIRDSWIYYISDAYVFGVELKIDTSCGVKEKLEELWQKCLEECKGRHSNIRIFPYYSIIVQSGEEKAFSSKMWYMGKIPHTGEAQKRLCEAVERYIHLETYTPKKVLLLDLDNTLWGGLAGERDHKEIMLSEDGSGLAYKNLQRVLLQMKNRGVLLAVVSKNNEDDGKEVLSEHPHMVLRPADFVTIKINWLPKYENIVEIARELNLGLDSMVFFDDNPAERQLVRESLPQVTVPDFPDRPEELAVAMVNIYKAYFEKPYLTLEDQNKTLAYHTNRERKELKASSINFDEYLQNLNIRLIRENPALYMERFIQLINKTNQFHLTTRRLKYNEAEQILQSASQEIFLYRVADRFGDNGIVIAAVVDESEAEDLRGPVITEFAMSCRVMGRKIEQAVIEDMERSVRQKGYPSLYGLYVPTAKNLPVRDLYPSLGYQMVRKNTDGSVLYAADLSGKLKRDYFLTRGKGEHYERKDSETD